MPRVSDPSRPRSPLDQRGSSNGPPTQIPQLSVGTPIKLAPSTSAFRKSVLGDDHGQPLGGPGMTVGLLGTQSPNKGMVGQVSDLIFGW
jgi:nuclear pore complex protein Nup53